MKKVIKRSQSGICQHSSLFLPESLSTQGRSTLLRSTITDKSPSQLISIIEGTKKKITYALMAATQGHKSPKKNRFAHNDKIQLNTCTFFFKIYSYKAKN